MGLQTEGVIIKFVYMNLLQPYILKLLKTNDCVVIPSFGAFLAREVSAYYDDEKQQFIAPGRELSFNILLTEDDGLLINYIAKYKKLAYPEAKEFVKEQVGRAQKTLNDTGILSLDGIGQFKKHAGNYVQFIPGIQRLEQLSCYGLHPTFTFTPITVKSIPMEIQEKATPEKKVMYRVAAGFIAAVIIAGIVLFFPEKNNTNVQVAGISVPDATEVVDSFSNKKEASEAEQANDLAQNNTPAQAQEEEEKAPVASQKVLKETERILAEEEKNFNSNPLNYYHIIISSSPNNTTAQKVANSIILNDGVYATVLDCGENYRVVNKTFTNRKRAFDYCTAFKAENPKFNDAWVYVEKNR